jgi:hypothetical protein
MELMTPIQPLPWEGEELLLKAKRVLYYEELKNLRESVTAHITELEESIAAHKTPNNPRQTIEQSVDKNHLRVSLLQRERIDKKMVELEENIRMDIQEDKNKETI